MSSTCPGWSGRLMGPSLPSRVMRCRRSAGSATFHRAQRGRTFAQRHLGHHPEAVALVEREVPGVRGREAARHAVTIGDGQHRSRPPRCRAPGPERGRGPRCTAASSAARPSRDPGPRRGRGLGLAPRALAMSPRRRWKSSGPTSRRRRGGDRASLPDHRHAGRVRLARRDTHATSVQPRSTARDPRTYVATRSECEPPGRRVGHRGTGRAPAQMVVTAAVGSDAWSRSSSIGLNARSVRRRGPAGTVSGPVWHGLAHVRRWNVVAPLAWWWVCQAGSWARWWWKEQRSLPSARSVRPPWRPGLLLRGGPRTRRRGWSSRRRCTACRGWPSPCVEPVRTAGRSGRGREPHPSGRGRRG